MAENKHVPDLNNPEVHHEASDVNIGGIVKFVIALVFLCGVSLLILAWLFKYFQSKEQAAQAPPLAIAIETAKAPPSPRLQQAPMIDLDTMRAAEEAAANSFGWADDQRTAVRIPIARAIDLLVARGLPVRPQSESPAPSLVSMPTESGLGPKVHQPGGPLAGELK